MKNWKEIDPRVEIQIEVTSSDVAQFETGVVHEVYSTFALGRDAEWCTRQFALALKEEDEEGIGTYLNIRHRSPAFVGETVTFRGELESVDGNQLHAQFVAYAGSRVVAEGTTGQKILKKSRLNEVISKQKQDGEKK